MCVCVCVLIVKWLTLERSNSVIAFMIFVSSLMLIIAKSMVHINYCQPIIKWIRRRTRVCSLFAQWNWMLKLGKMDFVIAKDSPIKLVILLLWSIRQKFSPFFTPFTSVEVRCCSFCFIRQSVSCYGQIRCSEIIKFANLCIFKIAKNESSMRVHPTTDWQSSNRPTSKDCTRPPNLN